MASLIHIPTTKSVKNLILDLLLLLGIDLRFCHLVTCLDLGIFLHSPYTLFSCCDGLGWCGASLLVLAALFGVPFFWGGSPLVAAACNWQVGWAGEAAAEQHTSQGAF